jgi:HAD superfamily hydrolase (TIGR01490 family)
MSSFIFYIEGYSIIMYAAFFDLDHTILSISSGLIMFKSSYEHGIISRIDILKAMLFNLLYRTGFMSPEGAAKRWLMSYRDMSVEMFAPIAAEWAEELKRYIRDDVRTEMLNHKNNGARTVILSASTTAFCELTKNELGMDDVICTELELVDGILTGRMKGRYCYGREKLVRARQYCHDQGLRMEDAYYYADSIADLPVMEAVGTPVCVTPDKRLEREALKRGWKINHWK